MTYEGAHSIIGPYLNELGATALEVGFIAGFGEMLAASLRLFSGRLADRTHAYWLLTTLGYATNVIAVPALTIASNWKTAALLVIAERTGKALRGPARDVLLSEATAEVGHGFGFGLHTVMDQTGAVIGPLVIAFALMRTNRFGPAFLWLAIPATGTMLALLAARILHPSRGSAARIPSQQTIPRVLAYHFERSGFFSKDAIPLLYAAAMAVDGVGGLAFGRLFDRFGIPVLAWGIGVSALSLPLGFLGGPSAAVASVALWGAGMGLQDAVLRAGIAQVVSMNKRGSAFGSFNAIFGVMWFGGTTAMSALYNVSLVGMVALGMAAQFSAVFLFMRVRGTLAAARRG
jgi:MFS family permease